ncbi:flotillin family protein [Sphaerobacter sp.]|uniref:flotillin family protein n=1 Tax=Sphaerobacter sp. TaxID=2099654 RepID=UPI001D21E452|nr:flotillin family protein [Sphaerobacter sp.]MBX5445615.1 flotillin family protein [Sphaerobacter sp.]
MPTVAITIAVVAVITVLLIMVVIGTMYRRVSPNRALIVYGAGGTRIVTGGGKLVWPLFQSYQELSLELMSFDVAPSQDLYTSQGVAVNVEAVAQIKVKSDPESIRTAAEQFLTKTQQEREALIRLVMEGHLRGIVGLLTVEQIVKEPEMVAGRVRQTVADDLSKMGLEVVSFTIKKVMDDQDYIANMGRPDVARIKREADIAQAEAERDTAIKRAMAMREAAIAQAQADQERVVAQTASEARQAEAQRDLEIKRAQFEADVRRQRALAEKAYDIAANQAQQQVVAEQVRIEQVQRQEMIKVQELEVQRRERELEATLIKQADAERRRIELLAEAERERRIREATGAAEAIRLEGLAEAEIIRAKGQAEADAMHLRAAAFQEYNQAAVLDKLLTSMPELAQAFAQSLAGVDKVTIVSTGDGHNGISSITGELAKMIAQVPELFETLTGQSVVELLSRLRSIEAANPAAFPHNNAPVPATPADDTEPPAPPTPGGES